MQFTTVVYGLLALAAGHAFAAPAPVSTSDGVISKKTKTTDDAYHITKLYSSNTTVIEHQRYNNITFYVHQGTNLTDKAFCTHQWPVNGTYYVEDYTPCSSVDDDYQFLITAGSYTNTTEFQLEVEHVGSYTVVNGQDILGETDFAFADVTKKAVGCLDYNGGLECKQVSAITPEVKFVTS